MEKLSSDKITEIDIFRIYPNKNQPRKNFDKEKIEELADSIEKYGLLQPIILKKDSNDNYMIVAGERRYTACRLIGMKKIPAIVKDISYEEVERLAIIENLQRENLTPIEEARAYKRLIDVYKITQSKLSEMMGKSRPYITNSMRLLNLNEEVIELLDNEKITPGHGKILLKVEDPELQTKLANKILRDKLSVRELDSIVENMSEKPKKKKEKPVYEKDLFIMEAEENLRNILGTKVNITRGRKNGKIEIEYYSEEDLEAIISMITD